MKPFLLLQIRPNDNASNNEYEAFLKHGSLSEDEVHRVRMEQVGVPDVNLDDYSGVIMGGGPSNVSDAEEKKSEAQKRYEAELVPFLNEIIEKDVPFLGACYGFGVIARHMGGVVSREKYAEEVGAIPIALTEEGEKDPLTQGLPKTFDAFGGHKEACQNMPEGVVNLATSESCPYQMFRVGQNVYGTQFHPELDVEGICLRINIYKHAGYFPPEDAEPLIEQCKKEHVTVPVEILKRFVKRYRKE